MHIKKIKKVLQHSKNFGSRWFGCVRAFRWSIIKYLGTVIVFQLWWILAVAVNQCPAGTTIAKLVIAVSVIYFRSRSPWSRGRSWSMRFFRATRRNHVAITRGNWRFVSVLLGIVLVVVHLFTRSRSRALFTRFTVIAWHRRLYRLDWRTWNYLCTIKHYVKYSRNDVGFKTMTV